MWRISSCSLIPVYTIHPPTVHVCPLSMCVPSFNLLGLTVPEESVTKICNIWKLERKKNIRPLSTCIPSFNLLGLAVPQKKVTKIFNVWKLERKKNEEIKGWISSSSQILVYTIHPPIVQVYTKFQPSRPHSSWEKCDEKFSLESLRNDRITEWWKSRANPV